MAKLGTGLLSVNLSRRLLSKRAQGEGPFLRTLSRTSQSSRAIGSIALVVVSGCSTSTSITPAPALGEDGGLQGTTLGEPNASSDTGKSEAVLPSEDAGIDESRAQLSGEELFSLPFPGAGNERSCATCHVPDDNYTLTPEHVEKVWEENPSDPLFSAIDADDPTADELTFEHLKKGLVRVWLTLPDNTDLIDDEGSVITPTDRKIFVWRSVPSVEDSALTAPYQLDGRVAALEEQAQGAITGHSEGGEVSRSELERIAEFQRTIFSNDRARQVAKELASGVPFDEVSNVEDSLKLTAQELRGKDLFDKVCATCHGGANTATIIDREVHDMNFYALKSDGSGNVQYQVPATDPPNPVYASQPHNEFLNVTLSYEMYLAGLGVKEENYFTKDLSFPAYRVRFYADASRQEIVADLPPAGVPFGADPGRSGEGPASVGPADSGATPTTDSGVTVDGGVVLVDAGGGDPGGGAFAPVLDDDGNPLTGPSGAFQFYSVDPGRALITGSPLDFEGFDVPSLRGISKTAPYFRNNIVTTLEEVVQLYSDHLLSKWPQLVQPGEKESDDDGDFGPPEVFTAQMKLDLVAYLNRL